MNTILWGRPSGPEVLNENFVWNTSGVWGNNLAPGRIIGMRAGDAITWGSVPQSVVDGDNILWGTWDGDNILWGTWDGDNILWGTSESNGNTIIRGTTVTDGDNILWGTLDGDNILWGTCRTATTSSGAPRTATTSSGARRTATTSSGARCFADPDPFRSVRYPRPAGGGAKRCCL